MLKPETNNLGIGKQLGTSMLIVDPPRKKKKGEIQRERERERKRERERLKQRVEREGG